jgi:hypothetical protein
MLILPIAFLFTQGDFPVPFFSGCSFWFAACELGQHRIASVVLHVKNWFSPCSIVLVSDPFSLLSL